MQQSGFLVRTGAVTATLLTLAGCGVHPLKVPEIVNTTPNPFANNKRAAHCVLSPLQTDPSGQMRISMTVTAGDEGMCPFSVSKGGGGSFVSFGVVPAPEHGKAFLYNYDNRTYVEYTPAVDYKGNDAFSVELIPAHAQPRRLLKVDVHVEAPAGAAGTAPASAPSPVKTAGKAVVHAGRKAVRTVRRTAVKAARAVSKAAGTVGKAVTPSTEK